MLNGGAGGGRCHWQLVNTLKQCWCFHPIFPNPTSPYPLGFSCLDPLLRHQLALTFANALAPPRWGNLLWIDFSEKLSYWYIPKGKAMHESPPGGLIFLLMPVGLLVAKFSRRLFLGPRGPLRVIPSTRPPVRPQSFYFSHLQPPQRHRH